MQGLPIEMTRLKIPIITKGSCLNVEYIFTDFHDNSDLRNVQDIHKCTGFPCQDKFYVDNFSENQMQGFTNRNDNGENRKISIITKESCLNVEYIFTDFHHSLVSEICKIVISALVSLA